MKPGIAESVDAQSKIGVVIVAAGASVRMGRPKQVLPYRGETLIRWAVGTALASVCHPVVVVIGAHAELMKKELECLPVSVADNSEWNKGISSSIRLGVQTLAAIGGEVDGAVIMLCDQPFVTVSVVNALVETRRMTGKMIVASAYGEARGVPALFSKELFGEITALKGNEGAKQVIANHADDVATVCFPGGAVDVDTPQEYETLEKIFERPGKAVGVVLGPGSAPRTQIDRQAHAYLTIQGGPSPTLSRFAHEILYV